MKVSNNKVGGQAEGVKNSKVDGARGKEASIGAAKNGKAPKESANVAVSDRAQMMSRAKSIAGEQTVDEAKVSRLQKMIDEGKYSVDADKIADRLVDQHLLIPDDN